MPDIADLDVDGTAIAYDSSTPLIEIDNLKDNLLHVSVALTIQRLTNDGTKEIKDAQIKTQIVSENANALSWLFNKGIDFFRKTSTESIMEKYKIDPNKKNSINTLKAFAAAIPVKHLFGTTYEKYRKVVSGKVESWVSNYLKRLSELNSICESKVQWKINDEIFHEDYNHLFNGIDLQKNDLKQINTLHKNIANDINQEIELLSGKKDNLQIKRRSKK